MQTARINKLADLRTLRKHAAAGDMLDRLFGHWGSDMSLSERILGPEPATKGVIWRDYLTSPFSSANRQMAAHQRRIRAMGYDKHRTPMPPAAPAAPAAPAKPKTTFDQASQYFINNPAEVAKMQVLARRQMAGRLRAINEQAARMREEYRAFSPGYQPGLSPSTYRINRSSRWTPPTTPAPAPAPMPAAGPLRTGYTLPSGAAPKYPMPTAT